MTIENEDLVQVKATWRVPGEPDKATIVTLPRRVAIENGYKILAA